MVKRALARRPEDRFQLPLEMQAALRPGNAPALGLTAVDTHRNVFVVDRDNHRIQELKAGN